MRKILSLIMLCTIVVITNAQTLENPVVKDSSRYAGMTEKQQKQLIKKERKDSIRAHKKVWLSILGGPSYTPEASVGIGGALLASFKLNKYDSISQRSFIPVGFNISLNGTFVAAGAASFFFKENKFRLYTKYGFRREPANFYGVGFNEIDKVAKDGDSTLFRRSSFQLSPRFLWEAKPHFYVGGLFDINFNKSWDVNSTMAQNSYYQKFGNKYRNVGLGFIVQYDSRDDVATPYRGVLLSAVGQVYGKYLGGNYNYELLELEYRHFINVFRPRSTLGWIAKSQIGFQDVPYTELPMIGSPFDLRGLLWGKYRDKSSAFGILEYRHMFGSQEQFNRGAFVSKLGLVGWVGTGTLGKTPLQWKEWKLNYGVGLRIQMQPRKNFRIDVGQEPGGKWLFYMNMTEAF